MKLICSYLTAKVLLALAVKKTMDNALDDAFEFMLIATNEFVFRCTRHSFTSQ